MFRKKVLPIMLFLFLAGAIMVHSAQLPTIGGDTNNWGTILNEYLNVSHNADGTLKDVFKNENGTALVVGGEVTGTVGSITINNDALDDQYYDSEADLTALLDDNYISTEINPTNATIDHDALLNFIAGEHFTVASLVAGSSNITNNGGILSFNLSCEQITGSADLCDGADNTGGSPDLSATWNFANNDSLVLDNTTIIRVWNITGWDRDESNDWNLGNLTTLYPNLDTDSTDDYATSDFTTDYNNRDGERFKIGNMTIAYPNLDTDSTDDYATSDFTTDYNARDGERFKIGNMTIAYPNLDTDSTDDLSSSSDDVASGVIQFDQNISATNISIKNGFKIFSNGTGICIMSC